MIRVMLVDDHAIVRESIKRMLSLEPDFFVVGEAANGGMAVALARKARPDVVVMDVAMPGVSAFEATEQIISDQMARVLFVTMYDRERHVRTAFRVGASGYLLKSSGADELYRAVREVAAGRHYIDPSLQCLLPPAGDTNQDKLRSGLTWREEGILKLVAEGRCVKEIAAQLNLSPNTVQVHKVKLMRKLGLRNVREVTRFAVEHEIVELGSRRFTGDR
jgi:DNA-binding NarL/FixJ family response regulator